MGGDLIPPVGKKKPLFQPLEYIRSGSVHCSVEFVGPMKGRCSWKCQNGMFIYVRLCEIVMLVFYALCIMMNEVICSQLSIAIGFMMLSST